MKRFLEPRERPHCKRVFLFTWWSCRFCKLAWRWCFVRTTTKQSSNGFWSKPWPSCDDCGDALYPGIHSDTKFKK